MGSSHRVHPSWNEDSRWLSDTGYARQRPPSASSLSSSVNGPVSSMQKPPSLGAVLRDLPIILSLSLPPRACFNLASASNFCMHSREEGGHWAPALQLPPLFVLPMPSLLLRPSVSICSAPPEWDWPFPEAWETMSLPSHERQVFAESNAVFIRKACFEDLVSVIVSEACVCHEGCTDTKVSKI